MNVTVEKVVEHVSYLTLGRTDIILFVLLLALSLGVGVYYSWCGKKSDTTEEYLLAERKLEVFPAAISIMASKISATSIMLLPVEVYTSGIQYVVTSFGMFFAVIVMAYVVAPVYFATLNRNCYEYLELRFDKKTRQVATVSFLVTVYLLMPVVLFIPALAFSQVSGINVHVINGIVSAICVIYTMLGGVKAVVWTDFFQGIVIFGSAIAIAITGTHKVGGLNEVFSRAADGGRLEIFNITFDITERVTFWSALVGGSVVWFAFLSINQSCVQRIIALPSLQHARKTLWIFLAGFCFITTLCCYNGVVMYAKYYLCDPIMTKVVTKGDKMMPYFVQDILGEIPGMSGLFISCVFSAGLSTMSANIHSLSGVVYFDYIRPYVNHTEAKANFIMKLLILITGIYCIGAGLLVGKSPSILQLNITLSSVAQGTMVGVFLLGMLFPRANSISAFIASVVSLSLMAWLILGAQIKQWQGKTLQPLLPMRIDGCPAKNVTTLIEQLATITSTTAPPPHADDGNFTMYKISFMWFATIGALIVWLIAVPLSFIIGKNEIPTLDQNLISPVARFMIPKEYRCEQVAQEEEETFKKIELKTVE